VADNSIKTSKYTATNFVPLNLMVQFSKLPNIYFLIIGIMQMIPQISVSAGFPVIFIPLSFVVGVSAVKDFFEDLKRKNSDREINKSIAHRLTPNGFEDVSWESLRIGDVIRVQQNEQFPADAVLLQSSEDKLNCYI
jgi:phospholipid-transporting ATPase